MTRVAISEAKERLEELLLAAAAGEEVVVTMPDGHDVRVRTEQVPRKIDRSGASGIWKGKVWMSDDFDEPLEDFRGLTG